MRIIVALLAGVAATASGASARDSGQWAQADPDIRQWFNDQWVPGTGMSCCSVADGVQAEEDIRLDADGTSHYWARFTIHNAVTGEDIDIPWTRVPHGAVLKGPFPPSIGQPIVWWTAQWDNSRTGAIKRDEHGSPAIIVRCYKPGSGV
jgi:hypothetical protein